MHRILLILVSWGCFLIFPSGSSAAQSTSRACSAMKDVAAASPAALQSIGHVADSTEHYARAYCALTRLTSVDPARKGIAYDFAIASFETGRFAESTRHFIEAEQEAAAEHARDRWLQAAWMDGYGRVSFGDASGARAIRAEMLKVDPQHAGVAGVDSYLAHFERRFDDAIAPMRDRVNRGVRTPGSYAHIGDAFLAAGSLDSARRAYEQALSLDTTISLGLTGHAVSTELAAVALAQRRNDEANRLLRRSEERVRRAIADGRDSQVYPYDMAAISALRGDTAAALTWLSRAIDQGWRKVAFTRFDPLLVSLHGSKRFETILARDDSLSAAERRASMPPTRAATP